MIPEIWHMQVAQQNPAVRVRIGAHPPIARRRKLGQFFDQSSVFIEQLLGLVAFHPAFEQSDVLGVVVIDQKRHLVRTKGSLDLQTIDDLRSCPALR